MGVKEITVSFVFSEEYDEDCDEVTLEFSGLSSLSNLTSDQREEVAERWAQSDRYHIGITNAILETIATGKPVEQGDMLR